MNILEIVSGGEVNGAVVHCVLLSKELARLGHSVTLLCRHNSKLIPLLEGSPVEIIESDMHRIPMNELKRVTALAHERKIDLIHTHMTRAHNFGVCLRRFSGIPCIATAHSHIVQFHWMFADYVISVSDATKQFQRRRNFVRESRIETVHGFMDYDRVSNVSCSARNEVRSSLGIGEKTPLIGIIGDIIPRKGHIFLIRALPAILVRRPEARLLVVGSPKRKIGEEYFQKIQAEAQSLGVADKIIWAGYRSDIPQTLAALDVYVSASLDEMFPVAVLEAMAAKAPIVATSVGGVPECLKHCETALLVPSGDPLRLGDTISQLLEDSVLASRLATRAQQVAHENFSLASQAPRIEAVFRQVIKH